MFGRAGVLFNKLGRLGSVSRDDRSALEQQFIHVQEHTTSYDISRIGDSNDCCSLLLEGFACRHKISADGERQIISLHVPGDILDLMGINLAPADHNISTIGRSVITTISHAALRKVVAERAQLGHLLWRDTLIEAAIYREWIANIGMRQAPARIAHLFCELLVRLRAVGQAHDHSFASPFSQQDIADALGLSMVHVNRTVKDLRRWGLIELNRGHFHTNDWDGLTRVGEFDPAYLYELSTHI